MELLQKKVYQNGKEKSSLPEKKVLPYFRISGLLYKVLLDVTFGDNPQEDFQALVCILALARFLDEKIIRTKFFRDEHILSPIPYKSILTQFKSFSGLNNEIKIRIFKKSLRCVSNWLFWTYIEESNTIQTKKDLSYKNVSNFEKREIRTKCISKYRMDGDDISTEEKIKQCYQNGIKWHGYRILPNDLMIYLRKVSKNIESWKIRLGIYLYQRIKGAHKNKLEDITLVDIFNNSEVLRNQFRKSQKLKNQTRFKNRIMKFTRDFYNIIIL